ncbi:MAG TPA: hypothetical protein VHB68_12335, partial [Steroidobacteraceae bacterium]|nr:hypothetical protein [Steroidobacteraceae bacterium]
MNRQRRALLVGFGGIAVSTAALGDPKAAPPSARPGTQPSPVGESWPRKADFDIQEGYTYLNAAYTHPIP